MSMGSVLLAIVLLIFVGLYFGIESLTNLGMILLNIFIWTGIIIAIIVGVILVLWFIVEVLS